MSQSIKIVGKVIGAMFMILGSAATVKIMFVTDTTVPPSLEVQWATTGLVGSLTLFVGYLLWKPK